MSAELLTHLGNIHVWKNFVAFNSNSEVSTLDWWKTVTVLLYLVDVFVRVNEAYSELAQRRDSTLTVHSACTTQRLTSSGSSNCLHLTTSSVHLQCCDVMCQAYNKPVAVDML